MTSSNMYRVGDFVYFEVTAAEPYQIRKIEELNKTNTGAVEAKVVCFYRRRDLSEDLVQLADKHQNQHCHLLQQPDQDGAGDRQLSTPGPALQSNTIRQLHHRELFLSHHLETLPATHIRGKCTVTLHSDTEPWQAYLSREDTFFYQLVYDPVQKTLQADRGAIRQGPDYQAAVADHPSASDETDKVREELLWRPGNGLDPVDVDGYLLLSRSLATLGRAFHPSSIVHQPNMAMSLATACRDTSLQMALDNLHAADYQVAEALTRLAPDNQPLVRLDEMEQWSASEGNLFEEAVEKYGKAFYDIQADFLPWKPAKSVIQFYYMWKTTEHYVQQRRIKASEAEHHLKQVYIPNYNKPNTSVLYPSTSASSSPGCEACSVLSSLQWFALGPSGSLLLKVCTDCWVYWKRYADLKSASLQDKLSNRSLLGKTLPGGGGTAVQVAAATDRQPVVNRSNDATTTGASYSSPSSSSASASQLVASGIAFAFVATPHWRAVRQRVAGARSEPHRRSGRCPFRAIDSLSSDVAQGREGSRNTGALPCRRTYTPRRSLQLVIKRLSPGVDSVSSKLETASTSTLPTKNVTATENPPSNSVSCVPTETSRHCNNSKEHAASGNRTLLAYTRKRPHDSVDHPSSVSLAVSDTGVTKVAASDQQETRERIPSDAKKLSTGIPAEAPVSTCLGAGPGSSVNLLIGPKRRTSLGVEYGHQTTTVMFRCHEALKRSRRRLLSIVELRCLGRRPLRGVYRASNSLGAGVSFKSKTNPSVTTTPIINGLVKRTITTVTMAPPTTLAATSAGVIAACLPSKISSDRHGHGSAKTNGSEEMKPRPSRPVPSDS